jgi:hypothetical protein
MSWNRVRVRVVVVSLAGLGLSALGCSGSSKPTDPVALCNQTCDKVSSLCAADAAAAQVQFVAAACRAQCQTQASSAAAACSNSAAILSAYQQCLTKNTCAELTSCAEAAPQCAGTGSGGASGTGGAGSGGSTGSGSGGASGSSGGASGSGGVGTGSTGTGGTGLIGLDGGIPGFDGSIPGFDGSFSLDGLTIAGTCADLLACCNSLADATSKTDCLSAYNLAKPFGDTGCGAAYTGLKQGGTCQ